MFMLILHHVLFILQALVQEIFKVKVGTSHYPPYAGTFSREAVVCSSRNFYPI